MSQQNLETLLQTVNPVELLRNSQIGAYVYPVVPTEFGNWRDEQAAWRNSAVLFDQSHHMAEMMVEGPDAFKLLSYLAINSFANFPVDRAKQFVPVSYDGFVIGDGILFRNSEHEFNFVGRAPTVNWIQFHARPVATTSRSPATTARPRGRAASRCSVAITVSRSRARMPGRCWRRRMAGRSPTSSSSRWTGSRSPAAPSAACATAWPAPPASRSGAPMRKATKSAPPSSKPARNSA